MLKQKTIQRRLEKKAKMKYTCENAGVLYTLSLCLIGKPMPITDVMMEYWAKREGV